MWVLGIEKQEIIRLYGYNSLFGRIALGFRRREFIDLLRQKLIDKKIEGYWYEEGMEYMTMDELLIENAIWKDDLGTLYSSSYKKAEPMEIYYSTRGATRSLINNLLFVGPFLLYSILWYSPTKGSMLIFASIAFFFTLILYIHEIRRLKSTEVAIRLDQQGVYINDIHQDSELYGAYTPWEDLKRLELSYEEGGIFYTPFLGLSYWSRQAIYNIVVNERVVSIKHWDIPYEELDELLFSLRDCTEVSE